MVKWGLTVRVRAGQDRWKAFTWSPEPAATHLCFIPSSCDGVFRSSWIFSSLPDCLIYSASWWETTSYLFTSWISPACPLTSTPAWNSPCCWAIPSTASLPKPSVSRFSSSSFCYYSALLALIVLLLLHRLIPVFCSNLACTPEFSSSFFLWINLGLRSHGAEFLCSLGSERLQPW